MSGSVAAEVLAADDCAVLAVTDVAVGEIKLVEADCKLETVGKVVTISVESEVASSDNADFVAVRSVVGIVVAAAVD